MESSAHFVAETLSISEDKAMTVVVSLIALIITCLLLLIHRLRSRPETNIILTGLSDAGKTVLFSNLVAGTDQIATFTSVKENVFEGLKLGRRFWTLVDVPGADKVRRQVLERWTAGAAAAAFVVDSASFPKMSKDVAEWFYDVLTELPKHCRVLVVCNKQDLLGAKSAMVIRSVLEKELSLVNRSRASALETTEGSRTARVLFPPQQPFSWELLPQPLAFLECSLQDPSPLQDWLRAL